MVLLLFSLCVLVLVVMLLLLLSVSLVSLASFRLSLVCKIPGESSVSVEIGAVERLSL